MVFSKEWYKTNPHPRGMLGKKASAETRKKMSEKGKLRQLPDNWGEIISKSKLGKPRSEETKRKISETRKRRIKQGLYSHRMGADNNFWRGGTSSTNKLLRNRKEYHWWRVSVFERDNYTCQHCGTRSAKGRKVILQADHIKPFALFPELRYAIDNGQTLCLNCHKKTDSYLNNKIKKEDYA